MRILVVGATGTIGKAVVQALKGRHEVLEASRNHGTYPADITSKESLLGLFRKAGPVEAIISAAGGAVPGIPAAQVARAYVESVEGSRSGQVLDARKFTAWCLGRGRSQDEGRQEPRAIG